MYANRTALTGLMSVLEDLWKLNKTQLRLINSAFFLFYAAAQIPAGFIADRIGRKRVLIPGFFLHALGTIYSGLAAGFPWLLGARCLTGLSQGTYYSPQYAISTEVIPPKRRNVASAITMSGSALGMGLGTYVAGIMVWRWGYSWRTPLILFGSLALLLSFIMARVVAPTLTGLIVDMTGSFSSAFLLAAMLQAIAWGILLTVPEPKPESAPGA